MSRQITDTLKRPDGSAYADVTVRFVADRTSADDGSVVQHSDSTTTTDASGALSIELQNGVYLVYVDGARSLYLGKATITDGDPATLAEVLGASEPVTSAVLAAVEAAVASAMPTVVLQPTGDTTGAQDDALFDAAHAALAEQGGGVIEYAAGTFYTKSPRLVTADNIGIKGQGIGITKLVVAAGFSGVGLGGSSIGAAISFCSVSNFFCIGMDVDAYTNNVKCNGIQNVPIGFPSSGTPCSRGLIAHNRVRLKASDHVYHIWNFRGQDVAILENHLDGNTPTGSGQQEGIELYGGKNVLIFGNTVKNMQNVGIYAFNNAAEAPNTELENIRVIGNYIDKCGTGIEFQPRYDATNGDMHLKGALVEGNHVTNCRDRGVWIRNVGANCTIEDVVIRSNFITCDPTEGTTSYFALRVTSEVATTDYNMSNVVVADNTCQGSTSTSSEMVSIVRAKGVTVRGNKVQNQSPQGNVVSARINASTGILFCDNTLDGAGLYGLHLLSVDGVSINGNEIINYGKNTATSGILVTTSGENLEITDNVFDTATTPLVSPINVANANTYYLRGNRFRNILGSLNNIAMVNFGSGRAWTASTSYSRKQIVRATSGNTDFYFECVKQGTSGGTEPTWNVGDGAITADNTVTWVCRSVH